jgi:uncharacterized OsmC-like protein
MKQENNGVQLENIAGLIDGIKANPSLSEVTFNAKSKWLGGTQAEVEIAPLLAGGEDISRSGRKFTMVVDEPAELGGLDEAPNPVEYLATALCGCITAGIATNAALFDCELHKIEVSVDVNFNIHGILGLDRSYPNGPLNLHYKVKLAGPGAAEAMEKSKLTIDKKSPIRNAIELPLQVTTEVEIEE